MKWLVLFGLACTVRAQFFSPFAPSLPAYNSFYDGAVGSPFTMDHGTETKQSVFNPEFEKNGFDQIYRLDASTPMPTRVGEFNGLLPFYNPAAVSRFDWVPHPNTFQSPATLGSFSYDINEPRYNELYKSYYKFFNTDLGLKTAMIGDSVNHHGLQLDKFRKEKNPESYDYKTFYDQFPEDKSLRGRNLKYLAHKEDSEKRNLLEDEEYNSSDRLDRLDPEPDHDELESNMETRLAPLEYPSMDSEGEVEGSTRLEPDPEDMSSRTQLDVSEEPISEGDSKDSEGEEKSLYDAESAENILAPNGEDPNLFTPQTERRLPQTSAPSSTAPKENQLSAKQENKNLL